MQKRPCLLLALLVFVVLTAHAKAQLNTINYYTVPTSDDGLSGITAGPDGALWFLAGEYVGQISLAGSVSTYPVPGGLVFNGHIAAGSDGNLWFTNFANGTGYIGRICARKILPTCPNLGYITPYTIRTPNAAPVYITAGSDGNLWFTEWAGNNVGRICAQISASCLAIGDISEFPTNGLEPWGIATGVDGNIWFTQNTEQGGIEEMDVEGHLIGGPYYPSGGRSPLDITPGADGALWFGEVGSPQMIGRICTSVYPSCPSVGAITEYPLSATWKQGLDIVAGADGALWFTGLSGNSIDIGRITTDGKAIKYYSFPGNVGGLASGPDGALWFTGDGISGPEIGQAIPSARRNGVDLAAFANVPTAKQLSEFQLAGVQHRNGRAARVPVRRNA